MVSNAKLEFFSNNYLCCGVAGVEKRADVLREILRCTDVISNGWVRCRALVLCFDTSAGLSVKIIFDTTYARLASLDLCQLPLEVLFRRASIVALWVPMFKLPLPMPRCQPEHLVILSENYLPVPWSRSLSYRTP